MQPLDLVRVAAAGHLMGSGLDAAKTVSSLTLFEAAGLERAEDLLDRIGRRCTHTLDRLG